jgi:hypothetical protein
LRELQETGEGEGDRKTEAAIPPLSKTNMIEDIELGFGKTKNVKLFFDWIFEGLNKDEARL